jgi:acyl-CoA dehydrogenase
MFPPLVLAWRLNPIGQLPSDDLGHQVAQLLQRPGEGRDRLSPDIYQPPQTDDALGRLEQALRQACQVEPIFQKIKAASRAGLLPKTKAKWLVQTALEQGIITRTEMELLGQAQLIRDEAIQVDSFSLEDYMNLGRGRVSGARTRMNH